MRQDTYIDSIEELTERMQWEVSNVIDCISESLNIVIYIHI